MCPSLLSKLAKKRLLGFDRATANLIVECFKCRLPWRARCNLMQCFAAWMMNCIFLIQPIVVVMTGGIKGFHQWKLCWQHSKWFLDAHCASLLTTFKMVFWMDKWWRYEKYVVQVWSNHIPSLFVSLYFFHAVLFTSVSVTFSFHSVPFTLFLSLCSFHSVPFTLFLSLCSVHFDSFTLLLSLCSFHSVSFTPLLSLCFFHSVPFTLFLFTLCLSVTLCSFLQSFRWSHQLSRADSGSSRAKRDLIFGVGKHSFVPVTWRFHSDCDWPMFKVNWC